MAYKVKNQNKTYWVLNAADMKALSSIGHAPPFTDEEIFMASLIDYFGDAEKGSKKNE